MSSQHPHVVYLGDVDTGRRLFEAARPLDWIVYLPATTLDALGTVVLYYPDVVLIDHSSRPTVAAEVYQHLRTLTDGCPPIIDLTREVQAPGWTDRIRYALPPTDDPDALMAAVRAVVTRDESISE